MPELSTPLRRRSGTWSVILLSSCWVPQIATGPEYGYCRNSKTTLSRVNPHSLEHWQKHWPCPTTTQPQNPRYGPLPDTIKSPSCISRTQPWTHTKINCWSSPGPARWKTKDKSGVTFCCCQKKGHFSCEWKSLPLYRGMKRWYILIWKPNPKKIYHISIFSTWWKRTETHTYRQACVEMIITQLKSTMENPWPIV